MKLEIVFVSQTMVLMLLTGKPAPVVQLVGRQSAFLEVSSPSGEYHQKYGQKSLLLSW